MGLLKWLKREQPLKFHLLSSGDLFTLERILKWCLMGVIINFVTNIILLIVIL